MADATGVVAGNKVLQHHTAAIGACVLNREPASDSNGSASGSECDDELVLYPQLAASPLLRHSKHAAAMLL